MIGIGRIPVGAGAGFVPPMLVGPKPTLRVGFDSGLQGIPTLLGKCGKRGIRRALDGRVMNDVVASIGEGEAFHGDD